MNGSFYKTLCRLEFMFFGLTRENRYKLDLLYQWYKCHGKRRGNHCHRPPPRLSGNPGYWSCCCFYRHQPLQEQRDGLQWSRVHPWWDGGETSDDRETYFLLPPDAVQAGTRRGHMKLISTATPLAQPLILPLSLYTVFSIPQILM